MRALYFFKNLFFVLNIFVITACGKIKPEGNIGEQTKKLEAFNKISLKGNFRVFIIPNSENLVQIETYPNISKNLSIDVKDNRLQISEYRKTEPVDFYSISIFSKNPIKEIKANQNTEVNTLGLLQSPQLNIWLDEDAKLIASVQSQKINLEMKQNTRANLNGNVDMLSLKMTDSTNLIAPYLRVKNLDIFSQKANYAEINVLDSLKGFVKNNAKFLYYGNPVNLLKTEATTKIEHKNID